MTTVHTLSLFAATLTSGLIAGLFTSFAWAVMPGLGRADDRTFVTAMRQINRAILNGWFLSCFLGAPLLTIVALVTGFASGAGTAPPWIAAGLVLYLVMFGLTAGVNVPLNNQLDSDGDPAGDVAPGVARQRFERRWNAFNRVRAVTSTAAFGCLLWALLRHGATVG